MRVLVACEFSGRVRDAFLKLGHEAISCDLRPSEAPGPHLQCDVRDVLTRDWDLVIGFPPCTDTTWANGSRIHEKRADGRTAKAIELVEDIFISGHAAAVESPYGGEVRRWRQVGQVVHPWMFGDPYLKLTGLWLRGLPRLAPSVTEEPPGCRPWVNVGHRRQTRLGPGVHRTSTERSRTFPGIAEAMARQWGGAIEQKEAA